MRTNLYRLWPNLKRGKCDFTEVICSKYSIYLYENGCIIIFKISTFISLMLSIIIEYYMPYNVIQ